MNSKLCLILDGLDSLFCKLLTLVAQFATLTAPRLYKPIPVSIYYTQAYAKIITLLIDRNRNPRLSAGGVRGGRLHYFPLEPPISNTVSAAHEAKSMVCRVGSLGPSTFLPETKLYTTTESPSGEPFAITRDRFVMNFVSTTLLLEAPAELTEIRPSAGKIIFILV